MDIHFEKLGFWSGNGLASSTK